MTNPFDVTGKVALVTGASSGLGAHFAKLLAANGAKVVVAARRADRLEKLVGDIRAAGGEAAAAALDVLDSASIAACFDAAEKAFGTVTILANNAGVADVKRAVDMDEKSWDFVMDTNLKGVFLVAQEAGRRMLAAGVPGSVVNTASIAGMRATRGHASYGTSKAAVIQLTRILALEWARKGVRVNALCPGYFETEINSDWLNSDQGKAEMAATPAGRPGVYDELSGPFMLLASDSGRFLNGVALPVDGGHAIA